MPRRNVTPMLHYQKLRSEYDIPHDSLTMRVTSSPISTIKVQRIDFTALKSQYPQASIRELLKILLISRIKKPPQIEITDEEIESAMGHINSFDDLCDYIIKLEEREPSFPDPFGLGKKIDEILAQEEVEKRAPSENIINSLEQIYFDLKERNPDRDEHWFLANTWLTRYGSSKQSKQKGAEWAKFVAYKDTLQFSILEPPQSIRGLALFLIYMELGEEQALYYADEFSQIMKPIMEISGTKLFFDKYKQKNPRTWEENQVIDDSSKWSRMLHWLITGLDPSSEAAEAWDRSEMKREIEKPDWKATKFWRY
jgi:hypothetical protein